MDLLQEQWNKFKPFITRIRIWLPIIVCMCFFSYATYLYVVAKTADSSVQASDLFVFVAWSVFLVLVAVVYQLFEHSQHSEVTSDPSLTTLKTAYCHTEKKTLRMLEEPSRKAFFQSLLPLPCMCK